MTAPSVADSLGDNHRPSISNSRLVEYNATPSLWVHGAPKLPRTVGAARNDVSVAVHEDDPARLDLSGFVDPDEAVRRACAGLAEYTGTARELIGATGAMRVAHMAFMGFVARARGLHEAIAREIKNENPHAVFILIRGMAELATLLLYTNKYPNYIETVVGIGSTKFKRKSYLAMFDALRERAPGLKAVYAELSDYSHMGPGGIANAVTPVDDECRSIAWTDIPHWRSANDFRVACALTEEVVEMVLEGLREFGRVHISEATTDEIGIIGEHRPVAPADMDTLRTLEGDKSVS